MRRNIGFGLASQHRPKAEIARRVEEALALVRLEAQADKLPGQLSGGQQQRVAIARAIVVEPPLVLMDEPLSNLDAKLRLEMRAEIRRIHSMLGCSTIYVTHDQEEALSLADRIVVLIDGRMRQIGTPEELYSAPANPDVAEFMGYRNLVTSHAEAADGGVAVTVGRRAADRHARPSAVGGKVIVAIRPDDLHADRRTGRSPAKVEIAEFHGRDFYAVARSADGTDLYFRSDRRVGAGEMVQAGRRTVARAGLSRMSGTPTAAALAAARARPRRGHAAGAARRAVRAGAVHLSVPLRAGAVVPSRRRAARWRTTSSSSPIPILYDTICTTLVIAVPVTLLNVVLSVPVALRVRLMRSQRLLTTILVIPITLGTVMVAEGLLTYLGPRGWLNRTLLAIRPDRTARCGWCTITGASCCRW